MRSHNTPKFPAVLAILLVGTLLMPTESRADGAVAHGEDNSVGLSYGYNNQRDADRRALNECGGGCRVVRRFENTCASIATGRRGGYGYAFGDRLGLARQRALDECEAQGARGCTTVVSGCDE